MKKLAKAILIIFLIVGVFSVFLYGYVQITYAFVNKLPILQNGDIVFQTINSSQTLAIMAASTSVYTHVGVVEIKNDKPYVIEAVGPVREVPLEQWIEQGIAGRLMVKRIKDLTSERATQVLQNARKYYGLPYDFFFLMDDREIYCSELIYDIFLEAGLEIGRVEKIKDLNTNNFAVKNLMKDRWKRYPDCQKDNIKSFEQCLPIIMEQELVTPDSIAADKSLIQIYSNYD